MRSKFISSVIVKYGKVIILIIWLITTLLYLKSFGIVTDMEAKKYIIEANRFIDTGSFSAPRYWFYSITTFILVIAFKLHIGITGAFIIQACLNLFAYFYFYKALSTFFKNVITPFFIIVYLIAFSPYQSWVVFLFTESAFFSTVLILFSTLVLYKPNLIINSCFIAASLLLTILSRPLGILFVGATYIYLFYCAKPKWKIIFGIASLVLFGLAYYSINIIFSTIPDWHITQAFEQESIICDMPAALPYQKLDLSQSGSPVFQLWYYLTHNFSHFLHFAGIKMQYFFLMARPYYSKAHNYFLLLNVIPLYLLAFCSFFIKKTQFNKGTTIFLASAILIFTLTIIFQCDDYHNRFVLSIFPFFVILAARAVDYFISSFFKHNK